MFRKENDNQGEDWASVYAHPTEVSYNRDGTVGVFGAALITGTNEQMVQMALNKFVEKTGAEIIDEKDGGRSKGLKPGRHFFSSSTWSSPWEPGGPKPNWHSPNPPKDPSMN